MPPRSIWLLAFLLSAASALLAATAGITGTVTESGTASPATITITERTTGITHTYTADATGTWRAPDLPPGPCDIAAISPRTHASAHRALELHSGEQLTLPLPLTGGWSVLEVQHPADAPFISANPLDALRNASEITRGEQGGNVEGFGPFSIRGNFGVNSIGQRSQDNNFQLDGMDNNDPWLRGPVLNPGPEAISNATLTAVYTPATEGHQAGAVLNSITQSGTALWHGSGYDYLRNSALNAPNYFDGTTKPGTTENRFGGTLGGSVAKTWFLFGDLDATRSREGLTVISTVPTVAQKGGNFAGSPNTTALYNPATITQSDISTFSRQPFTQSQIPASLISQQARNLIALYPDPNLPGLANNFRYTPSAIDNAERYSLRTDKALAARHKLFARVNYERNNAQSPSALPGRAGSDSFQHADNAIIQLNAFAAAASETFTIRPTLLNELRLGLTRSNWTGTPADQAANPATALAIPGLPTGGLPIIAPEGYAQLGAAQGLPGTMKSTSYEVKDTVTFTAGRHHLVAGAQLVRRHLDGNVTDFTSRGTFTFTPDYTSQPNTPYTGNSIASLLLSDPTEVRQDIQLQPYRLRGVELAGFAQDTLHLSQRLTVTLGLRYSYDPPVTEADNRMVNFNYSRTNPALDQFAGVAGVNAYGGLSFNKRTIAPRVGFALDLDANGATVLRGGFSQDYDAGSYMAEGMLARNAPYETQLDLYNGTLQTGPTLSLTTVRTGIFYPIAGSGVLATQSAIYAIEPKSYTPYADQWGLFLTHRISPRLEAELSGSGSMGIHLHETYNINQPYPAPTPYPYERYPFPSTPDYRIQYLGFAGGSTYYGGQAKLTGQLLSNLRLQATWRYAKSIDDSTEPETTQASRPNGPQYIYNLRGNRSVSPFDVAQRVIVAASYNLPFQIRLDSLITLQSGFPFTPQLATNGLNNGAFQLPNRNASAQATVSQPSTTQWFNTSLNTSGSAFSVPALYQYGNSGFDILRGPGLSTVDAAVSRAFALGDKLHLQTRLEAANLFNRTNLALPNAILGLDNSGTINHTATPSRNMQLVAKLTW